MKTIKIPNETLEFLAWLIRQDVTLPSVITDYLNWNTYTQEQIRAHFQTLYEACNEAREASDRKKKRTN